LPWLSDLGIKGREALSRSARFAPAAGELCVQADAAIVAAARDALILRTGPSPDLWLWEHSERVASTAAMLSLLPELAGDGPDPRTVLIAALFHDAGWALQVQQGQIKPWQVLSRPTSDLQRELGAVTMHERLAGLVEPEVRDLAAEAIRQSNNRYTKLPEAQVVADAEGLDEIGLLYVLRQFRQGQAEGRPIEHLLQSWSRQLEYQYWDARINDCLRFEFTRGLARERVRAMEGFMAELAREREAADVWSGLKSIGVDPTAATPPS
jgi:5'-deoxynucleotidase YfbR-like HD superfamily hydrolase